MFDVFGGLALGFISSAMFVIMPLALLAVGVPYVVLRMRDTKSEHKDPELGLKVAYSFFFSVGVILLLTGLTINAADLIIGDANKNNPPPVRGGFNMPMQALPPVNSDGKLLSPAMRIGWGLASSGLLFLTAFGLMMAFGTNTARFPAARRVYIGARLTLAGLMVIVSFTTLLIWAFQKETVGSSIYEIAIGILCVWLPTLAIHIFLMRQFGKTDYFVPPPIQKARRRVRDEEDDDDDIVVESPKPKAKPLD